MTGEEKAVVYKCCSGSELRLLINIKFLGFCLQQLYNNAVSKARTLVRGKNRDKRNAMSMD